MNINRLEANTTKVYFDIGFMAFIDQHLPYIKSHGLTMVTLTSSNAYKHAGNFYGILAELNIPHNYHYAIMRINGLLNSNDYDGIDGMIKLPNLDIVDQLRNQYKTLNI